PGRPRGGQRHHRRSPPHPDDRGDQGGPVPADAGASAGHGDRGGGGRGRRLRAGAPRLGRHPSGLHAVGGGPRGHGPRGQTPPSPVGSARDPSDRGGGGWLISASRVTTSNMVSSPTWTGCLATWTTARSWGWSVPTGRASRP